MNSTPVKPTMRIQTRIALLIGVILSCSGVFGWFITSILSSVKINGPYYHKIVQGKDIIADILPPPEYLIESYLNTYQLASERDLQKQAALISKSKELQNEYEKRHEFWQKDLGNSPLKSALVEESYQPGKQFLEIKAGKYIPAVVSGDWKAADEILHGPLSRKYEEHLAAILKTVDLATQRNQTDEAIAAKEIRRGSIILFVIGICIMGLVILIGVFINHFITSSLTMVIQSLASGSERISSASREISENSQQLANGSSDQASSLEETSSSLEVISSMTRQNSDSAKQANSMAMEARTSVEKGQTAMQRMNRAIGSIKNSSDQTVKIVKTIDEIAFQTNLLALNAAVEAARAGDAGKGFAVVAEEVRNLAQRSAEAAKTTTSLIEESQRNAENGVTVSQEVTAILGHIVTNVTSLSQLIGEVTTGTGEQTRGIEQIGSAVTEMDQQTQSNAASAEQSASASQELTSLANELNSIVNHLVDMVQGSGAIHSSKHQ